MKSRYGEFNPKRRIKSLEKSDLQRLEDLGHVVRYGGNPEHKMNPGDFGLSPPSEPRVGKSLCDDAGVFSRKDALALLKDGLRKGLVSDRLVGKWPKNIWTLTADGKPIEAQLENSETGTYHGYPMPSSDPLAAEVVRRWEAVGD